MLLKLMAIGKRFAVPNSEALSWSAGVIANTPLPVVALVAVVPVMTGVPTPAFVVTVTFTSLLFI